VVLLRINNQRDADHMLNIWISIIFPFMQCMNKLTGCCDVCLNYWCDAKIFFTDTIFIPSICSYI